MFDLLIPGAETETIYVRDGLVAHRNRFSAIWPRGITVCGLRPNGLLVAPRPWPGFFARLSRWLALSLYALLREAGFAVNGWKAQTGLAQERQRGLFVEAGAPVLRDPAPAQHQHDVDSPLVIEWPVQIVALVDTLAPFVCARLGRDDRCVPLD